MKKYRSLVINPGSTSTKIGVFEDLTLSFEKNIGHTPEQLAPFADILDQLDFRKRAVLEALEQAGVPMAEADVTMIPQTWVELTDEEDIKKINRILDLLDEDDDVQATYHNWDE